MLHSTVYIVKNANLTQNGNSPYSVYLAHKKVLMYIDLFILDTNINKLVLSFKTIANIYNNNEICACCFQ